MNAELWQAMVTLTDMEMREVTRRDRIAEAMRGAEEERSYYDADELRADLNEERADELVRLMATTRRIVDDHRGILWAIGDMADALSGEMTAYDVGCQLSCDEADTIALVMLKAGQTDAARAFLAGHAVDDGEDDAHYNPNARTLRALPEKGE